MKNYLPIIIFSMLADIGGWSVAGIRLAPVGFLALLLNGAAVNSPLAVFFLGVIHDFNSGLFLGVTAGIYLGLSFFFYLYRRRVKTESRLVFPVFSVPFYYFICRILYGSGAISAAFGAVLISLFAGTLQSRWFTFKNTNKLKL